MHGIQTEKQITIPNKAKSNIFEYIAMQMEGMDDKRLQNKLDAYWNIRVHYLQYMVFQLSCQGIEEIICAIIINCECVKCTKNHN